MQMKVDNKCGRCGKVATSEVSMEEAQALVREDAAKKAALADLETFTGELSTETNPDLIVLVKAAGGYTMETLDNLCSNPENKTRSRGCGPRVTGLIDEIFGRTVRKPTTKKTTPPDTGETKPLKKKGPKV